MSDYDGTSRVGLYLMVILILLSVWETRRRVEIMAEQTQEIHAAIVQPDSLESEGSTP